MVRGYQHVDYTQMDGGQKERKLNHYYFRNADYGTLSAVCLLWVEWLSSKGSYLHFERFLSLDAHIVF